jgi:hypothetical protein
VVIEDNGAVQGPFSEKIHRSLLPGRGFWDRGTWMATLPINIAVSSQTRKGTSIQAWRMVDLI